MTNNPLQYLQMLKANPVQFLLQRRLNIPQNITNNPDAILDHLLKTQQVSQQQVNQAYLMAQSLGRK